jgi:hypothetical protein
MRILVARSITAAAVALLGSTTAPPGADTAMLAGVVMSREASPRPVRRATVTLHGGQLPGDRMILTDDDGRFVMSDLPAGRFTLSVSKVGWVTSYYGAREIWQAPGVLIALADAERRTNIEASLMPGAVISGRILDDAGRPEPDVMVMALQSRRVAGRDTLVSVRDSNLSKTDDRGVFRIYGLPTGDFFIGAGALLRSFSRVTTDEEVRWARALAGPSGAGQPGPAPSPAGSYGIAFYPGVSDPGAAAPIRLSAGEERTGVDLTRPFTRTVPVQGAVQMPDGQPARGLDLSLGSVPGPNGRSLSMEDVTVGMLGFILAPSSVADADGSFSFADVLPGQYQLRVRAPGLWAAEEIAVGPGGVTGLSIRLQSTFSVSGRITFDGGTLRPPENIQAISLQLLPRSPLGAWDSGVRTQPKADGTFTFEGIAPGRYLLFTSVPRRTDADHQWFARSAMVHGQNMLDVPVELRSGDDLNNVEVIFSDRSGEITGVLSDAAGRPVRDLTLLVFSTVAATWTTEAGNTRTTKTTQPDATGRFRLDLLPAGEYYLAALTDPGQSDIRDPAFLEQVARVAIKIALAEGERKVQDIQLRDGG